MRRAPTGLGRGHVAREVDDELAFHLEMRTQKLIAAGMLPADARHEALRHFGDIEGVKRLCVTMDTERERSMKRKTFVDEARRDLVYAARMLRRNLGVTLTVVLTLALGIGANGAILTLINAVLLRKLPVRAPDELVAIGDPSRPTSMSFSSNPQADLISYRDYKLLRERDRFTTGLLASGRADRLEVLTSRRAGEADRPRARYVSGNYFQVLGVPALRGRTFDGSEDASIGAASVITISHGYWTRRFSGDSAAIGREVLINGSRFTIIGVTPPWFTGEILGQSIDLWVPITMQGVLSPNRVILDDPQAYWLLLLGRRAPGVTPEQATSGLTTLVRQILTEQTPNASAETIRGIPIFVSRGAKGFSRVRAAYEAPLITLMVGVGILLLIICANVANLLLARAVARTKEMSVRMAIGAGRARLVRQLLTESFLLAFLGAAIGLLFAGWGSRLLLVLAADGSPTLPIDTSLDAIVVGSTVLLSVFAVATFGLVPALRTSRVDLAAALRASAKSTTGAAIGARDHRLPLGKLLISIQVAMSLVLLLGAALLVRNLWSVQNTDTGLDRDHLLIVEVDANARGYVGEKLMALAKDLSNRLRQVSGVESVSFSENGIFSGTESATTVGIPGFSAKQQEDSIARYDAIGPGYVHALGARLLQGRDFTVRDDERAAPVVLVNESFARFYFGSASPVGTTIRVNDSTFAQVAGVVADVKDHELTGAAERRYYTAYLQHPFEEPGNLRLIVRTRGDPASLTIPVRRVITALDPQLSVIGINPLSRLMRDSIRQERLLARLASGFGLVALVLAAVGLYGVMTYAITRRTSEIGLRVALGARRGQVVGMVLRDALRLVGLGVVIGVPLAVVATKSMENQLQGVKPTDPVAIAVTLAVLVTTGVLAALSPAMRASRVPPVEALREE